MCCLFGMIDYKHTLSRRQKTRIVRTLAESLTTPVGRSVLISTQALPIP